MKPITPNAATARETKRELRAINTQLRAHARTYHNVKKTTIRALNRHLKTAAAQAIALEKQGQRDLRAITRAVESLQRRQGILQGRLQ